MATVLMTLNYTLVLFYGALLSIDFAGGYTCKKERILTATCVSSILILQLVLSVTFGVDFTTKIYPLITHLPLVLLLVIGFKKNIGIALVSVLTAYFCCQLPRWVGALAQFLFQSNIAFLLAYTVSIIIFFFLLRRYFSQPAYHAMTYSKQSLILFACLPLFYYIFDYATTVYTSALYQGIRMISEFLPAVMALFYVLFIVTYHSEMQRKNKIEMDNALLKLQLEQAANQIENTKMAQELSAIYRHDLRHHLSLLRTLAENGDIDKLKAYLVQTENNVVSITPVRYCSNEVVNLVLSTFDDKSKKAGVTLVTEAKLPRNLTIPDTELCTILSNGLENAILAASQLKDISQRVVRINCNVNRNKLLLLIQNAYCGKVEIKNQIPTANKKGHGFGCRSIQTIAEKRNGYATFQVENGIFTLRIVLPLGDKPSPNNSMQETKKADS